MEKLIKLLNESEDGFCSKFVSYDGINGVFRLDNGQSFHYTLILSKEYCFIKWLVENKKIDTQKFREKAKFLILSNSIKYYEILIMELSIQKNPIKFLVSILK